MMCTGRPTVTGILPFAHPAGKRPHDAFHRLFGKSRWQPAELWKRLAQWLIGLFYPSGMVWLDLDDTVFHHTGKKIDGAAWWRNAARPTAVKIVHCWGLNLVVLTLRVNLKFPILPWCTTKTHPSFQDALAALRRMLRRKLITSMLGKHTRTCTN